VLISGHRISAIGKWPDLRRRFHGRTVDLGEVALLPGLVNAHCHLDYTAMAGHLPPPKIFTDWLKLITELKSGWTHDDYRLSWMLGADMLLAGGTTTVADIEASPDLLPAVWRSTPLRIISFLEMIGITGKRSPRQILVETHKKIESLPKGSLWQTGLSPHAPYSTLPELLSICAAVARQKRWPVCMHIAESELEHHMFSKGAGPMHAWLQRSGRDMSDCGRRTPLAHVAATGILNDRFLAVHLNYLGRGDIPLLRNSGAHVVHCPRSHAYFAHKKFPLARLRAEGVNVCLGTDSLASVLKQRKHPVSLSMFEEMRALMSANPEVSPRRALNMATVSGARALGLAGRVGELSRGAFADLIAVPLGPSDNVFEAVAHHSGPVIASMIHGAWKIHPRNGEAAPHQPN